MLHAPGKECQTFELPLHTSNDGGSRQAGHTAGFMALRFKVGHIDRHEILRSSEHSASSLASERVMSPIVRGRYSFKLQVMIRDRDVHKRPGGGFDECRAEGLGTAPVDASECLVLSHHRQSVAGSGQLKSVFLGINIRPLFWCNVVPNLGRWHLFSPPPPPPPLQSHQHRY